MQKENHQTTQNVIKKVTLNNFMCHSNFEMTFDHLMTAITGQNGAGKSAVMVGLGILFGRKSNQMDRGKSFVSLIKTGEQMATIKVYLLNIYNLEDFEEEIVLEKKIYREKGSTLKIRKNKGFQIIKNSELQTIIRAFKLDFSNPMNFLTQDSSKKILNVSTPSELYNFYYEGTEFKNIETEIEEGAKKIEEMEQHLKQAHENKTNLEKEIKEKQEQLDFVAQDFNEMLNKITIEEDWADVADLKHEVIKHNKEIDKRAAEAANLQSEFDEMSSKTVTYTPTDTSELTKEIEMLDTELKEVENEYETMKNEFNSRKKILEDARSRNNKQILEEKLKTLNDKNEELEKRKVEFNNKLVKIEQSINAEKESNERASKTKRQIEAEISNLETNGSNKLTYYIRRFDKITNSIQHTSFRDQVIGPIFKYVEIKDRKWSKPASIVLKRTLESFVVFNSEDKQKLHNLFKQNGENYPVLELSSKTTINPKKVGHLTLLDILKLKDPILINVLITLHSAEEIVLLENRNDAYDIISKNRSQLNCAYLPSGDRIKYQNGGLSDYREKESSFYYFDDSLSHITYLKSKLSNLRETNNFINIEKNITKELEGINIQIYKNKREIRDIEAELDSYQTMADDDLNKLERKLMVMSKQSENMEKKRKQLKKEKEMKMMQKSEIVSENERQKLKFRRFEEDKRTMHQKYISKIYVIESEQHTIEQQLRTAELKKQVLIERLKKQGPEIKNPRNRDDLKETKARINSMIIRANEMGNKALFEKDIEILKSDVLDIEKLINKFYQSIKATHNAITDRSVKRDEIKNIKTVETCEAFVKYTQTSGYEGELIFDHESKKLNLKMKVHNNTIKGGKNTLSGGERSFAGVCFLLSLWQCFNCPVKILDEFDVFMDDLNRKNAINRICEFAKDNSIQIILITPLDVNALKEEGMDIKRVTK